MQQDGILSRKFHSNRQHTATVNHRQYFQIHRVTSMIWIVSESLQVCYNCGTTQTILQWCHLNELNLTKTPSQVKTDRQTDGRLCSRRKLSRTEWGLQVSTWRPTTPDIAAVLSHSINQHVTLIMRKRELFRHAPSFLPAKKHSVLSCSVSLAHPFEFFNFSLPYYHNIQILSPCLALTEQRVRQGSICAVFEVELRVGIELSQSV